MNDVLNKPAGEDFILHQMINSNDSEYVISWNSLKNDVTYKLIKWGGKTEQDKVWIITSSKPEAVVFTDTNEDYNRKILPMTQMFPFLDSWSANILMTLKDNKRGRPHGIIDPSPKLLRSWESSK